MAATPGVEFETTKGKVERMLQAQVLRDPYVNPVLKATDISAFRKAANEEEGAPLSMVERADTSWLVTRACGYTGCKSGRNPWFQSRFSDKKLERRAPVVRR
jgi:hypothetical protein